MNDADLIHSHHRNKTTSFSTMTSRQKSIGKAAKDGVVALAQIVSENREKSPTELTIGAYVPRQEFRQIPAQLTASQILFENSVLSESAHAIFERFFEPFDRAFYEVLLWGGKRLVVAPFVVRLQVTK